MSGIELFYLLVGIVFMVSLSGLGWVNYWLDSENTYEGPLVATFIGCIAGLAWPVVAVVLLIFVSGYLIGCIMWWIWRRM